MAEQGQVNPAMDLQDDEVKLSIIISSIFSKNSQFHL